MSKILNQKLLISKNDQWKLCCASTEKKKKIHFNLHWLTANRFLHFNWHEFFTIWHDDVNKNLPNVHSYTVFWKPSITILCTLPAFNPLKPSYVKPNLPGCGRLHTLCSQDTLSLSIFLDLISGFILNLIYISNKKTA